MVNYEGWKDFKKAYKKAVKDKEEMFIYNNKEILTKFAKYLIEHHDNDKVRK